MPWDSTDNRLTRGRTLADEIQAQIRKAINHRPAAPATVAYGSLTYGDTTPGSGQRDVAFLDLTDTPDTYVGQASKIVAVNAGATALEFVAAGAGSSKWSRGGFEGTALAPLTAGDTVSYSTNSIAALKVEQDGVKDNVLVVDTTNAIVGMTADVTVTAGTLTSDVGNTTSVSIDSDITTTADVTTADKEIINESIIADDPGAGIRRITSTSIDHDYSIDFSAIVTGGVFGDSTYKMLDFDYTMTTSNAGTADNVLLDLINLNLVEIISGSGVAATWAGNFLTFSWIGTPVFTVDFTGAIGGLSLALGGGTALTTTNRTGTGNLVLANTPTLITPVIGVATGTSLALGGGTALATTNRTGTGNLVLETSPTLVTPIISKATTTSTSTSLTFTSAHYGLTVFWSPGGTATATLPANGAAAGTWFDVILCTSQTVTISAATVDTLITVNDATADSVAFSTANLKLGSNVRFISNGSYWIAINLGSTTMTVAT